MTYSSNGASTSNPALGALFLSEDPAALLAGVSADLDSAWRDTAGGLVANADVREQVLCVYRD